MFGKLNKVTEMLKTSPHLKCGKKALSSAVSLKNEDSALQQHTIMAHEKKISSLFGSSQSTHQSSKWQEFLKKKFRIKRILFNYSVKTILSLLTNCGTSGPFSQKEAEKIGQCSERGRKDSRQFPLLYPEICKKFFNNSSILKRQLARIWGRFTNPCQHKECG